MSVFTNDVTVEPGTSPISVTGSAVSVTNFPAVQPVSGTVAVTQSTTPWVVSAPVSSTSTVSQITSTGTNQTLLAANVNRKKVILFFASGIWNIKFGTGATATSFTYLSNSSNTVITDNTWTGQIDAICTTSGKLVNITELV